MLIKIRFNTESLKSPEKNLPEWRVIYDGKEQFARSLRIQTMSWSTCDEIEPGVLKWHITTEGIPVWNESENEVLITSKE
jgi:hypothetical protein